MEAEFQALSREFNLLKDYNATLQSENNRKNDEIKFLQMELSRMQNVGRQSRYVQVKDCKNCVIYRSEIIKLKEYINHLQHQKQNINLSTYQKFSQIQNSPLQSAPEKSNRRSHHLETPQKESQKHALELEMIELRGKSQKIITENADLKKMLHEKNLQILKSQNANENSNRQAQQYSRAEQQHIRTLKLMQNRIDELQQFLSGNQHNFATFKAYQKENTQLTYQLSQNKQTINHYTTRIQQLQSQLQKIINKQSIYSTQVPDSQKYFLKQELTRVSQQKIIMSNRIKQLQIQNNQNLNKIKDLKRRISILESSNQSLQTELKNCIKNNLQPKYPDKNYNEVKLILQHLQKQIQEVKQYLMKGKHHSVDNKSSFFNQRQIEKKEKSFTKASSPYPHFNNLKNNYQNIKANANKILKQQRSITNYRSPPPTKQSKTQLKWQELQQKIGQLKYENQTIKNELFHH